MLLLAVVFDLAPAPTWIIGWATLWTANCLILAMVLLGVLRLPVILPVGILGTDPVQNSGVTYPGRNVRRRCSL